jgi:dolichol-phosphate mannosyltransferase
MDRKIVDKLNELPEKNKFVRGIRSWLGYKQVGLEYERDKRLAGKPKFTFSKLVKLAFDGLISFSHKPLSAASYLGMIITVISFIVIVSLIFMKLFIGIDLEGWTSTFVAILFMGGVQLMFLGILGEYIGRIYDEVKNRPEYIVKETSNIE